MDEKYCFFLVTLVCIIGISKSRVIVPRALSKDGSFRNEEIPLSINPLEKDRKLDFKPIISEPPTVDDDYNDYKENIDPVHRPFDDDYLPGRGVNEEDNISGTNPERLPEEKHRDEEPEEIPGEKDSNDKIDDKDFNKPLDEEDFDKTGGNEKDLKSSPDEDKPIHKDGDESEVEDNSSKEPEEEDKPQDEKKLDEENPGEEKIDEEKPDEERFDEENPDEGKVHEERKDEEKDVSENNDEHIPEESNDVENKENEIPKEIDEESVDHEEESNDDENKENDIPKEVDEETLDNEDGKNVDESVPQEGEPGYFNAGSFFDTPFFNLEQVKKYFSTLEKALGHVFRQTVDEAVLLNGTYANTTEEEVEINGKKYIVTKSVIKGADNHSVMYVEALSAKPKMTDPEVVPSVAIKNVTAT